MCSFSLTRWLYLYDAVTKEDTWWDAEVIDADIKSEDKENPNFFILYKESADESWI